MLETTINNILLKKDALLGNSFQRALHNNAIRNVVLSGLGVDLGAKNEDSPYYDYMSINGEVHFTDYNACSENIMQIDFEQSFDIDSEKYDYAIAFNVLEHVFNYNNFLTETFRILKNDGLLILQVPFIKEYHPDHQDYFRYTHTCLEKILNNNGFDVIENVNYGVGAISNAINIGRGPKPRWLRYYYWRACVWIDKKLSKYYKVNPNFYMGSVIVAKK